MKAEHQEHLGGPAAEALDRGQALDHALVRQRLELVELQPAVDDARAQIAEIADLLPAQPDPAKRGVGLRGDRRGVRNVPIGEERDEPPEDRRRGLGREAGSRSAAWRAGDPALAIGHPARADA